MNKIVVFEIVGRPMLYARHCCSFAGRMTLTLLVGLLLTGVARAELQAKLSKTDTNGVRYYSVTSAYLGEIPTTVRILHPTHAGNGMRRVLYVLPVASGMTDLSSVCGDGLEQIRVLDLHNQYGFAVIAPSFHIEPWYGDHPTDASRRLESFVVRDLVPWADRITSAANQPERWLIGFSKSGFGALSLILRNPDVFAAAAAWDAPVQFANLSHYDHLADNFGTEDHFDQYEIPRLIAEQGEPFRSRNRLWISGDECGWTDHMLSLHHQMKAAGVRHTFAGGTKRLHKWDSGWLEEAVASLDNPGAGEHAGSTGWMTVASMIVVGGGMLIVFARRCAPR